MPVLKEENGEEEPIVLPAHTKVLVTGNNRTKSMHIGLQGVVKKAVGLGGWYWLVLTNGDEVKLQRNALSVIEAPTENEENDGQRIISHFSSMNTDSSFSSIFQEIVGLPQQKRLPVVDPSSNQQLLFPRVFVPPTDIDFKSFTSGVKSNRDLIEEHLLSCGAILLRGFPVSTASDFNDVVEALGFEEFPYIGGAASRTHVTGRIFTSNEAPPEKTVTFHHEMSNLPEYPSKLHFFCEKEPVSGGETPIVFSNHIYQQILKKHPDFVLNLEELGLTYTRFLGNEDDDSIPVGRSWKSSFVTDDKNIAEERAAKMCMKLEWVEDGVNTTTGPLPAFKMDEHTGNKTWFNAMFTAYDWKDGANGVAYGDGTPLPSSIVEDCHKLCHQECVAIPWEKGDVLLLNNLTVLHSRRSFQPPRRILASLAI